VLLEESARSEPKTTAEIEWYRSVLNVGTHYRWDMGCVFPASDSAATILAASPTLSGRNRSGAPCFGRVIADEFWRGGDCRYFVAV